MLLCTIARAATAFTVPTTCNLSVRLRYYYFSFSNDVVVLRNFDSTPAVPITTFISQIPCIVARLLRANSRHVCVLTWLLFLFFIFYSISFHSQKTTTAILESCKNTAALAVHVAVNKSALVCVRKTDGVSNNVMICKPSFRGRAPEPVMWKRFMFFYLSAKFA